MALPVNSGQHLLLAPHRPCSLRGDDVNSMALTSPVWGIEADMDLAPSAVAGCAMLACLPFAIATELGLSNNGGTGPSGGQPGRLTQRQSETSRGFARSGMKTVHRTVFRVPLTVQRQADSNRALREHLRMATLSGLRGIPNHRRSEPNRESRGGAGRRCSQASSRAVARRERLQHSP